VQPTAANKAGLIDCHPKGNFLLAGFSLHNGSFLLNDNKSLLKYQNFWLK
jgi:hypothetical protein